MYTCLYPGDFMNLASVEIAQLIQLLEKLSLCDASEEVRNIVHAIIDDAQTTLANWDEGDDDV